MISISAASCRVSFTEELESAECTGMADFRIYGADGIESI